MGGREANAVATNYFCVPALEEAGFNELCIILFATLLRLSCLLPASGTLIYPRVRNAFNFLARHIYFSTHCDLNIYSFPFAGLPNTQQGLPKTFKTVRMKPPQFIEKVMKHTYILLVKNCTKLKWALSGTHFNFLGFFTIW